MKVLCKVISAIIAILLIYGCYLLSVWVWLEGNEKTIFMSPIWLIVVLIAIFYYCLPRRKCKIHLRDWNGFSHKKYKICFIGFEFSLTLTSTIQKIFFVFLLVCFGIHLFCFLILGEISNAYLIFSPFLLATFLFSGSGVLESIFKFTDRLMFSIGNGAMRWVTRGDFTFFIELLIIFVASYVFLLLLLEANPKEKVYV